MGTLLKMSTRQLSELLHGKRHVRITLALQLEALLGISAKYWMRVQVFYDLEMERRKRSFLKSGAGGLSKLEKDFLPSRALIKFYVSNYL